MASCQTSLNPKSFPNMKKTKCILFLLPGLFITVVQAQKVVLPSGGNATGSGGSVSYSIGQIAYSYQTGPSGSINQGVLQPF